ncbi:MAG: Fur family transcriptional regulator [Gammaproteobacteria bacterium]
MDALDQGLAAQLLAQHGIAPTTQRVSLACVMLDRHQHLSAKQVLDRLKRRRARVSKGTVYNMLRLFAARGLLRQLTVDRDRAFFDSNASHYHFYNVDDGTLTDFDAESLRISDVPALPEGTAHAGIDVIVRICNKPGAHSRTAHQS